jgi:hypothetical protein
MPEAVTEGMPQGIRPMFGSGFVSNNWSGATLDEGPGMIVLAVVMGAFCGLLLGLFTAQIARFLSHSTGRDFGGVGWTLICTALGAVAFGIMTADKD